MFIKILIVCTFRNKNMSFPKGSKNEALCNDFIDTISEIEKEKKINKASKVGDNLKELCVGSMILDAYKYTAKPLIAGGDLKENFIDELRAITHYKKVLQEGGIDINVVENIDQYGDEPIQGVVEGIGTKFNQSNQNNNIQSKIKSTQETMNFDNFDETNNSNKNNGTNKSSICSIS